MHVLQQYSSIPHAVPTVIPPALPADASPPPAFVITSWNASSLLPRGPAVQLYLHHYRPSILIVIEPRIQQTHDIHQHASYTAVHVQHTHPHGGFVIYMHRSITYQQRPITSCKFDSSTASTNATFHISSPQLARQFLLIPTYMSCSTTRTDWNEFTSFIHREPTLINPHHEMSTIIIGDLNAKDPSWDMTHAQ